MTAFLNQNFYDDLVYKFKKLIGRNDFSLQFRKIITRYRRIGYFPKVMRQSARLVFNEIMLPVDRASDSMMILHKAINLIRLARSFLTVACPTRVQLVSFFCSGFQ